MVEETAEMEDEAAGEAAAELLCKSILERLPDGRDVSAPVDDASLADASETGVVELTSAEDEPLGTSVVTKAPLEEKLLTKSLREDREEGVLG